MRLHSPFLISLTFAAACSSGSGPTTPGGETPAVAAIGVTGATGTLTPGATVALVATARDSGGTVIDGVTFTWSSSSSAVATVSQTGVVTAVTPGTATITATSGHVAGTFGVTVSPTPAIPVVSVTVSAAQTTLTAGDTATLIATMKDATGHTLAGRAVAWSSSAPDIATVSTAGVVTAVSAGSASIVATSEGVSSEGVVITVTPAATTGTLLEERLLAQQGLGFALAASVLQTQAVTFVYIVQDVDARACHDFGDRGADSATTLATALPYEIRFFYDNGCQQLYQSESITSFASDTINHVYHGIGTGAYYSLAGSPTTTLAFDEESDQLALSLSGITGIVHGFATVTPNATSVSAHVGINCDFGAGGHSLGICQAGGVQNFANLNSELGFVMTLALDYTSTNQLLFTATTTSTTGPIGSLTLSEPTPASMTITGGTAAANTNLSGQAGSFSVFPNTPTGWTITDSTHDADFTINVVDNQTRNSTGTIKQHSTGTTLAAFMVDQGGNGTITYSDHTIATITSWVLAQ